MREDTYKEVLAKKYARESNYVIIIPTDNLEELEELWNKFLSTMTIRQQRLCDDRSIQIYGMTNQQHYEALKADFIKHTKEPKKRDWGKDNRELSFKISPDDSLVNAKSNTFTTDTDADFEGLVFEGTDGPYFSGSGIYVIPDIEGGTAKEQLEDLEKHYDNYMSLTVHQRKLSDDGSRMMYGLSNQQRYDKLKGELLKDVDTSDDSDVVGKLEPDVQSDKANIVDEMFHDPNTFVGQHFLKSLEESKKADKPVKSRLNNTPYFTPTELIDMGVHGNDNYYSQKADNDGLTKDISSTTWFDSYKNMIAQHVYEDFTAEWINTLNRLYLDYDEIKECGTEEELLARKQSILDLGWNPEVPFTPENRVKASKRINDYMDHCVPRDIFINMDDIVPDDLPDVVEEAVSKKTHKPVFIILTKGKTPIISSGIQKVTKSEYSHASISFDSDLKELYSYNFRKENLGFVMEKLETIKNVPITVWCFFAESEVVENMKKKVYDFKTHDTHYDFRMLPRFIRKKDIKPDDNEYNQVCSTFVDTVLKAGNINLVRDINMPSPADIYDGIKTRANTIFKVYDGLAGQYNGKKIKKKVDYLLNKDSTEAVNEACKDVATARKFVREVEKLSKRYDANYFIVTDGASGIHNNGNPAVKNARDAQIEWEKKNGYDPDEDWSKKAVNEGIISKIKNLKKYPVGKMDAKYYQLPKPLTELYKDYHTLSVQSNGGKDMNLALCFNTRFLIPLDKKPKDKYIYFYNVTYLNDTKVIVYDNIDAFIRKYANPNLFSSREEAEQFQYRAYMTEADRCVGAKFGNNKVPSVNIDERFCYHIDNVDEWFINEAINDLKNGVNPYGNKTFYHLSFDEDLDEKTLVPRVPEWIKGMKEKDKDFESKLEKFKTENNPDGYGYEDPKTPRICFSNSIEGALNAIINPNKRLHLAGKQIYVFVPEKPISEYKTRSNKVIKKNGDVFDANITNEMWILEPCKVKFIGSIVVDKVTAKKRKKFTNNKEMNVMEYSYKWRWYHKISKKERFHEAVSIFNEMKKFPVEFDKDGNLIIYKCSTGNIDFDEEIDNSVTLLETYRNTNNEEGMKYELAKMWYIIAELEKRMKKRNVPVDEYNKLVRQRSIAMNVFKTNFKHMSSLDKNFNFAAYYNSTPFSDNGVKITNSTLRYGLSAIKRIVR